MHHAKVITYEDVGTHAPAQFLYFRWVEREIQHLYIIFAPGSMHTPAYNDQPIKEWQKLYIAATVWGL